MTLPVTVTPVLTTAPPTEMAAPAAEPAKLTTEQAEMPQVVMMSAICKQVRGLFKKVFQCYLVLMSHTCLIDKV